MALGSSLVVSRAGVRLYTLKQKLLLLFLFLLGLTFLQLQVAADDQAGALPITVTFPELTEEEAAQLQVFAQSDRAKARPFTHLPQTRIWRQYYVFWTSQVRLYLPPALLQRDVPFTIQIGDTATWKLRTGALSATWRSVPKPADSASSLVAFDSPPAVAVRSMPLFRGVLNGPEPFPFLLILGQMLVWSVLGLGLVFLSEQKRFSFVRPLRRLALCLHEPRSATQSTGEHFYLWGGLAFLFLSLALLVHGERYGFVHDDNITQFFPVILQGCESLEKGVLPTYNPFQLMGSPTATVGTYALTYPLTYLSYALAKYALGDRYLTLDLFVVLHLALGYLATFLLGRRVGLRPALALCAALSFVLCGYLMVYTRCWFYMAPVALWTPALLLFLLRLTDPRPLPLTWLPGIGLVIGLYFHAGNAQMWTYTLLLATVLVGLWTLTGRLSRGRLLWALAGLLVGLALAAPLLIAQAGEVAALDRQANVKSGALRGFFALFVPTPLVHVAHPGIEPGAPMIWNHLFNFAPVYYCGPVLLAAGLLGLSSLLLFRWNRALVGANAWLLCGGLAFVLSLGELGGLAQVLALLPGFNKFQHWWKFLPFVALFSALGGGLILERAWRLGQRGARGRAVQRYEILTLGLVPALLAYNAFVSKPVMSIPEKPYPVLPEQLTALVAGEGSPSARGLCLAPWLPEWDGPGLVQGLVQNFPTLYQIPMLGGYDPLVLTTPENAKLMSSLFTSATFARDRTRFDPILELEPRLPLQRYGVRWIFLTEGYGEMRGTYALEQLIENKTERRLKLGHTQVLELPGSDPLAFAAGAPEAPLPLVFRANGVSVDLGSLKGNQKQTVVVNFLLRKQLKAYVDGKPTPRTADAWGRVQLEVPTGAQTLELRYEPPWGKGLVAGGGLLLLALGLLIRRPR